MKVKFYYSNGFCGCEEEEVEDFPNAISLEDPDIINFGDEGLDIFMQSYLDARFVDYPDEDTFESEEDYEEACREAEEEYFEEGLWWCEEYEEEDD